MAKSTEAEKLRVLNLIQQRTTPDEAIGSSHFGGLNDGTVRGIVQSLRRQGYPICTEVGRGYYYASTSSEVMETIKYIESLSVGLHRTLESLYKTYNEYQIKENEFILGGIENENN